MADNHHGLVGTWRVSVRACIKRGLLISGALGMLSLCCPTTVFADAPATTDFGLTDSAASSPSHVREQTAMFYTLYADGHQCIEFRQVRDDTVVSFACEHSSWRLDGGLTIWLNMPVYVREVGNSDNPESQDQSV